MSRLKGKVALITGRRVELGEAVVAQIERSGGEAIFSAADVTRTEDCRRSIDAMIAAYGRIDILFNNVGIANAVLFLASEESSFMTGATLIVNGGNTAR